MKQSLIIFSLFFSFQSWGQTPLNDFLFKKPAKGVRTEAIVVSKNGQVLYEKFVHGSSNTRHLLWSMTKSISSLIFGIVEAKGYINKEDTIYKYYKEEIDKLPKKHAKKIKDIKLKDFLGMASGLNWNEYYEEAPFSSDVVRMLYFASKESVTDYVLKVPVKHKPGTRFLYSSGDTNIVMGAIQRALPKELKQTYPWEFFFNPMEMNATFEVDAKGVFLGSSYAYLTTGDLLKLGKLIIDKGMYKGKQVVPKEYLSYALDLNDPMKKNERCLKDHYMTYGAQFWMNHACADGKKPFKDAPSDLVMLLGHGGQMVFIFPTQKIVAARVANDDEKALDKNEFARLILEAYEK